MSQELNLIGKLSSRGLVSFVYSGLEVPIPCLELFSLDLSLFWNTENSRLFFVYYCVYEKYKKEELIHRRLLKAYYVLIDYLDIVCPVYQHKFHHAQERVC